MAEVSDEDSGTSASLLTSDMRCGIPPKALLFTPREFAIFRIGAIYLFSGS